MRLKKLIALAHNRVRDRLPGDRRRWPLRYWFRGGMDAYKSKLREAVAEIRAELGAVDAPK